MKRKTWNQAAAGLAAAVMLVLVLGGGSASAQNRPTVSEAGTINGSPIQVGTVLTASGGRSGPQGTTARWEWFACPADWNSWTQCFQRGLDQSSYTIRADDVGRYIVLNLYAYRGQPQPPGTSGRAERYTVSSSTVVPALTSTPTPTPTVVPTPAPTPTGTATPTAVRTPVPTDASTPTTPAPAFDVPPTTVTTGADVRQETARTQRAIRPFPVVRMRGRLTPNGAKITLFSVRAPRTATITVRCTGRSCPASRWSRASNQRDSTLTRMGPFERSLRAGVKVTVLVTREGYVGKRTTFVIRRGAAPRRSDRCLSAQGRLITCPAGV